MFRYGTRTPAQVTAGRHRRRHDPLPGPEILKPGPAAAVKPTMPKLPVTVESAPARHCPAAVPVRAAESARIGDGTPGAGDPPGLVLIGVSTGGPAVLERLLPRLPENFPWPVVVVQHMPEAFTGPLAERLDQLSALRVVEAVEAMPLVRGKVYVAKGGCDAELVRRGGRLCIAPTASEAERFWHPSVERMVRNAMRLFTPRALIGVMLTGMGFDGAEAMAELRRQGGRTVAESEDSAVVWGMPGELVRRDGASQVAPYEDIPVILSRWLGLGAPAAMPSHATLNHRNCR